jgi:hypothetical protein
MVSAAVPSDDISPRYGSGSLGGSTVTPPDLIFIELTPNYLKYLPRLNSSNEQQR